MGSPSTTKIYMYVPIIIPTKKPKLLVYFRRARTSNFLTRDLPTPKNTLSKSHGPRSLAAGPIRNAENMEFLLGMTNTVCVIR